MANRDAKLIERTLKDFSLGAVSGGSGVTPVDKLPEKGNVGALYKLPNGEIWSWYHEERQEEVEVPDIKAGDTLTFVSFIDSTAFCDMMDNILDVTFSEQLPNKNININLTNSIGVEDFELNRIIISCGYSEGSEDPCNSRRFAFDDGHGFGHDHNWAEYYWTDLSYHPTGKTVPLENNNATAIVVTSELLSKLSENNINLECFALLFENVPTKNRNYHYY